KNPVIVFFPFYFSGGDEQGRCVPFSSNPLNHNILKSFTSLKAAPYRVSHFVSYLASIFTIISQ
ncbi:MAG TPA: hypothetical protein P5098_00395, partial [Candidatus Dojkabacteria bacterium]|nr:hypothetical protein [Candidatus Dojkabacteria bacterium]